MLSTPPVVEGVPDLAPGVIWNACEALEMIGEVKGFAILKGFRNSKALDVSTLVQTILKVSEMMISLLEIKEIDLNPILVYPKGVTAVDVRVFLNRVQEIP